MKNQSAQAQGNQAQKEQPEQRLNEANEKYKDAKQKLKASIDKIKLLSGKLEVSQTNLNLIKKQDGSAISQNSRIIQIELIKSRQTTSLLASRFGITYDSIPLPLHVSLDIDIGMIHFYFYIVKSNDFLILNDLRLRFDNQT